MNLHDESVSLEAGQRIDAICLQYEQAWKDGGAPDLDAFLRQIPEGPERAALARELQALEEHYRVQQATKSFAVAGHPAPVVHTGQTTFPLETPVIKDQGKGPIPSHLGWQLGSYRVVKVIGTGGMGIVYEAEDMVLRRPVALKVMQKELSFREDAKKRFLREAQAAAALVHENVAAVYLSGEDHGTIYFAMQLLKGQTLAERMAKNEKHESAPLPLPELLHIGKEIAQGLAAAHEQDLIHRDIKPANLWLEEGSGRVKILDFGLARLTMPGQQELTETGQLLGTRRYMSPEALAGRRVDASTDLYSLGCVLHEMATGRLPGAEEGAEQWRPKAPHEIRPDLPRRLSDLIVSMLAADPAQRPKSARHVANTLATLEKATSRGPAKPLLNKRRLLAVAAGLLLALIPTALFFGGTIIRLVTNEGVIVIRAEGNFEVTITHLDGQPQALVVDRKTGQRFVLKAGNHEIKVELKNPEGKVRFVTQQFTLSRGETQVFEASWETAKAPAVPGEWVQLFNGTDLSGWKSHPKNPGKWFVKDGVLFSGGKEDSVLFSERNDYEDFHFRIEAKINERGNSGQFFRAQFTSGTPPCYEAQIQHIGVDTQKTGSLLGLAKIMDNLVPPAAWFTQEVIAKGNHIQILLNGKKVVDYVDKEHRYSKGHFALQHSQNVGEPVTELQVRKIEMKELPVVRTKPLVPSSPRVPWDSWQFDHLSVTERKVAGDGDAMKAPPELVFLLGDVAFRHWDIIRDVAVSPDGEKVISGGDDNRVRIWDTKTKQEIQALVTPRPVHGVCYNGDGTRIAAGLGTICVWNANTYDIIHQWEGIPPAKRVAFHPKNQLLVAAHSDGKARVWRVGSPKPVMELEGHDGEVLDVAWSRDGNYIATCDKATLFLWNAKTGNPVWNKWLKNAKLGGLAFDRDSKRVAVAYTENNWGCAKVWAVSNREELKTFDKLWPDAADSLAFSPNPQGKDHLAVSGYGYLSILNAGTGTKLYSFGDVSGGPHPGNPGRYQRLVYNHDGKALVVAGAGNDLKWKVPSNKGELPTINATGGRGTFNQPPRLTVRQFLFKPDGTNIIFTTDARGDSINVREPAGGNLTLSQRFSMAGGIALASPDGQRTAFADWLGNLMLWVGANKVPNKLATNNGAVRGLSFGPGNKLLAFHDNNSVTAWNGKDPQQTLRLQELPFVPPGPLDAARATDYPVDNLEPAFAFNHNGSRLALAGQTKPNDTDSGKLALWNLTAGIERVLLELPRGSNRSLAWHPKEKRLLFAQVTAIGPEAFVLDAETGAKPQTFPTDKQVIRGCFSPNGDYAATIGQNGNLILWNMQGTAPVLVKEWQFPRPARGVVFSPEGRHLAVMQNNWTVFVLRLAPAQEGPVLGAIEPRPDETNQDIATKLAAASSQPKIPRAWFELARTYRKEGRREEAIIAFKNAIELSPNTAGYHHELAWTYFEVFDFPAAVAASTAAVTLDKTNPMFRRLLAQTLRAEGRLAEGLDEARKAFNADKNNRDSHLLLVQLLRANERWREARDECSTLFKLQPHSTQFFASLTYEMVMILSDPADAKVYNPEGAQDTAMAGFETGASDLHCLAIALYRNRKWQDSFDKMQGAIGRRKDAAKPSQCFLLAMAHLQLNKNDYPGARKFYDEGVRLAAMTPASRYDYYDNLRFRDEAAKLLGIPVPQRIDFVKGEDQVIADLQQAVATNPKDAIAVQKLAKAYQDKGRNDEAIGAYKEAIALKPKDAAYHYQLAEIYYAQKKFADAVVEATAACKLAPNVGGYHQRLISALRADGRLAQALVAARKAVVAAPTHRFCRLQLVQLLRENQRWREARDECNALLGLNGNALYIVQAATEELVLILTEAPDQTVRKPTEALKAAMEARDKAPKDDWLWQTLGIAYYRNDDWKNTIKAMETAITLREERGAKASHLFFLAMAHWQMDEKEKARESYNKGAEWMETNKDNRYIRYRSEAAALLKTPLPKGIDPGLKDKNQVIADLQKAIAANPKNVKPYIDLADAYHRTGDVAKATQTLKDYLRIQPTNSTVVWRFKRLSQWDEMIRGAREIIRLQPKAVAGYHALGAGLQGKKHWQQAIEAFEEAIKRDNNYGNSYAEIAMILADAPDESVRNFPKALELAQKAITLRMDDPGYCWQVLGVAHYRNGDYPAAIKAINESIDLRLESPKGAHHFLLAMAYGKLLKEDQACACFDKGVKWMEENPGRYDYPDLLRYRAEAAQLLKIQDSKLEPKK